MNIWDVFIIAVLLAAVVFAFLYIKKHGGSCDGGCDGCPGADSCHKKQ